MYKVLQSTDWSFMIGGEVNQVAIGLADVQLAFLNDVAISIWNDFQHARDGRVLSKAAEMHVQAATLVSLLGKKVESVEAVDETALILRFSGAEILTILVDDAPYECFTVNAPSGLIVV